MRMLKEPNKKFDTAKVRDSGYSRQRMSTVTQNSLFGTDHSYFKLSKNNTLEENLQENQRKNYISGIN